MLLTIYNLPGNTTVQDVRSLIQLKCSITEMILDNFQFDQSGTKKITVGLPSEEDAAILMKTINGIYIDGRQLYVEDVRKKKNTEELVKYKSSTVTSQTPYYGYQSQGSTNQYQGSVHQYQTSMNQYQDSQYPDKSSKNHQQGSDPRSQFQGYQTAKNQQQKGSAPLNQYLGYQTATNQMKTFPTQNDYYSNQTMGEQNNAATASNYMSMPYFQTVSSSYNIQDQVQYPMPQATPNNISQKSSYQDQQEPLGFRSDEKSKKSWSSNEWSKKEYYSQRDDNKFRWSNRQEIKKSPKWDDGNDFYNRNDRNGNDVYDRDGNNRYDRDGNNRYDDEYNSYDRDENNRHVRDEYNRYDRGGYNSSDRGGNNSSDREGYYSYDRHRNNSDSRYDSPPRNRRSNERDDQSYNPRSNYLEALRKKELNRLVGRFSPKNLKTKSAKFSNEFQGGPLPSNIKKSKKQPVNYDRSQQVWKKPNTGFPQSENWREQNRPDKRRFVQSVDDPPKKKLFKIPVREPERTPKYHVEFGDKTNTWRGQAASSVAKELLSKVPYKASVNTQIFFKVLKRTIREVLADTCEPKMRPEELCVAFRKTHKPENDAEFMEKVVENARVVEEMYNAEAAARSLAEKAVTDLSVLSDAATSHQESPFKVPQESKTPQRPTTAPAPKIPQVPKVPPKKTVPTTTPSKLKIDKVKFKEQKKQNKLIYEKEELVTDLLDQSVQQLLDEELDLLKSAFIEGCGDPGHGEDGIVKRLRTDIASNFKKVLKVLVSKRILKYDQPSVRIYVKPKMKRPLLVPWLESQGVVGLKNAARTKHPMLVAVCRDYETMDRLCNEGPFTVYEHSVAFKPLQISGPPTKAGRVMKSMKMNPQSDDVQDIGPDNNSDDGQEETDNHSAEGDEVEDDIVRDKDVAPVDAGGEHPDEGNLEDYFEEDGETHKDNDAKLDSTEDKNDTADGNDTSGVNIAIGDPGEVDKDNNTSVDECQTVEDVVDNFNNNEEQIDENDLEDY